MYSAAPAVPVRRLLAEQLVDAVHDQGPIRQAGQRVMHGLESKLVGSLVHKLPRVSPSGAQYVNQGAQQHRQPDPTGQERKPTAGAECAVAGNGFRSSRPTIHYEDSS